MQFNINTTIEELLEVWSLLSSKAIKGCLQDSNEIECFRNIRMILKNKGVENLVFLTKEENYCTLKYKKNGGEFRITVKCNDTSLSDK